MQYAGRMPSHYKVKDETGRAVSRAIYNVLGINKGGHKELLGMYISKSEGANPVRGPKRSSEQRCPGYTDMLC